VPQGHLDERPTYWNGSSWSADPSGAVPVIPGAGRSILPAQVRWDGRQFIAVTKEGDWWGDTLYVDVAATAQGPWRIVYAGEVVPICDDCITYFASFVPSPASETGFVVGISNNTWEGSRSPNYGSTFMTLGTLPDPACGRVVGQHR
jgi:hypothetical protein